MTLSVGIDKLQDARSEQRAIVAAVAYDIVGLEATVAAGEQTGEPVIAQVGSSAFQHTDREALIASALALASASSTPVGIHLDHARDLEEIRRCLDMGYTSVMIDGSRLDLAENMALTCRAVEIAEPFDAWVEAELGHIGGDEDRSTDATSGSVTDPEQAQSFVAETGVDALAVCIGNVHGRTSRPVILDVDRLAAIATLVTQPLVLHGASGVPAETMAQVVTLGVSKLNVNADLRVAYLNALAERSAAGVLDDDLPGALGAARSAVTAHLVELIRQHSSR